LLNTQRVAWTSIDVARFITDGDGDIDFAKGGNSNKVLGLACHHILFKTDGPINDEDYVFEVRGRRCTFVQLLGTRAFD
jgi:hypothetical protein